MDTVTVLQVRSEVMDDAERRARAQALVDAVAERHSLSPPPRPDEAGSVTIVGLERAQVEEALDAADPGWRDEALFDWENSGD